VTPHHRTARPHPRCATLGALASQTAESHPLPHHAKNPHGRATTRTNEMPPINHEHVNDQLLIAYGHGRATTIYTTAYTFNAAHTALERCIAHHGRWTRARIVTDLASEAPTL
jgi:hypothetical protein